MYRASKCKQVKLRIKYLNKLHIPDVLLVSIVTIFKFKLCKNNNFQACPLLKLIVFILCVYEMMSSAIMCQVRGLVIPKASVLGPRNEHQVHLAPLPQVNQSSFFFHVSVIYIILFFRPCLPPQFLNPTDTSRPPSQ